MAFSAPNLSLAPAEISRWIQDGFREYGPDPWLFLRELAQNSRDAGAGRIEIQADRDELGRERLVFLDDGAGMSLAEARRFLFRFYASSKESSQGTTGRFGIGFWSVWRFGPERMIIASRRGRRAWALEVNKEFRVTERPAPSMARGTRVELVRPPRCTGADSFERSVLNAASRYCRHLTRRRPVRRSLPVRVNGRDISRPLLPPGRFAFSFRRRRVFGGAALGNMPEVRVFSGGLPLWRGTSIAELTDGGEAGAASRTAGEGLYPVIWMECPRLKADLSRRHPIQDAGLAALQREGERVLSRLFSRILDRGGGRGTWGRLRDSAETLVFHLRGRIWLQVFLTLLLLIPAEIFLLRLWLPTTAGSSSRARDLAGDSLRYEGADLSTSAVPTAPQLTYRPGIRLYFRLFTAEDYDPRRGFVYRPGTAEPAPPVRLTAESVRVKLKIHGREDLLLPHPAGSRIAPDSLRWNGRGVKGRLTRSPGSYHLALPEEPGSLEYACPDESPADLPALRRRRLTSLADIPNRPAAILSLEARFRNAPLARRLLAVREFTTRTVQPLPAAKIPPRFHRPETKNWLRRVMTVGRGDCDVINGFAVVLLRCLGIPARLGIGWAGRGGRLHPRLHAWAEYFDGKWRTMDLAVLPPGPAAAAEDENAPATPARGGFPAAVMTAVWLGAVLLAGWLLLRRRRRKARDPRRDEVLSRLTLSMLLDPGSWGSRSRLWTSAMLPCLDGHRLSLRRAMARMRRRGLFSASPGNPLARPRRAVLDAGNPHFQRLYRLIHGVVDLDEIVFRGVRPWSRTELDGLPAARRLATLGKAMGSLGWRLVRGGDPAAGPPVLIDLSSLNTFPFRRRRRPLLHLSPEHPACRDFLSAGATASLSLFYDLIAGALAAAPVLVRPETEIRARLSRLLMEDLQ